jgi:hypothetical protein
VNAPIVAATAAVAAAFVPALSVPAHAAPIVTASIVLTDRRPVGIGSIVIAVCETRASSDALLTRSTCTVAGAAQTVTVAGSTSVSTSTSAVSGPVTVCADGAASDLTGTRVAPQVCVTV